MYWAIVSECGGMPPIGAPPPASERPGRPCNKRVNTTPEGERKYRFSSQFIVQRNSKASCSRFTEHRERRSTAGSPGAHQLIASLTFLDFGFPEPSEDFTRKKREPARRIRDRSSRCGRCWHARASICASRSSRLRHLNKRTQTRPDETFLPATRWHIPTS